MSNEQFLTIPDVPVERGVRDALQWTIDVLAKEITSQAERIRCLSTWAPSIEIEEDAGLPTLWIRVGVTTSTIEFAKDTDAVLNRIGAQVRWEFKRYLTDHGHYKETTL